MPVLNHRRKWLASTMLATALSGIGASAYAADPQPSTTAADVQTVVVTGSSFRHKLADTDAPVTVITSADLANRGIATVQEGLQLISANGSSNLPNSFTANGAFAAGASAVSLRGLTTNSTLVLIDGLRTAYYPLADDGTRNFVDLNTIPDVIVDHIETLKDGASSQYGADAIAGVVNVLTKKTYEGVTVKAEGANSEHGGGAETNFQGLIGHGNLNSDGYNVYLGVEYEHDGALYNRERGFPYNTADYSGQCGTSLVDGSQTCRSNGVRNGLQYDGSFQGVGSTIVPVVRPYDPVAGAFVGGYQLLNPSAGCGTLKSVTVTPAAAAAGGASGIPTPTVLCQQDFVHDYNVISPDDKRYSVNFHATKALWGDTQAYLTVNYYNNDVRSGSPPSAIRQQSIPGSLGLVYSTAGTPGITLPVYICAAGVNCSASNGTLNPNNPFAANGQVAKIVYSFGDIPANNEQISNTYRVAAGLKGTFHLMGQWDYTVDAVAAESDLENIARGDIYIANLLSAVATGAYNFVTPSANTAAVRNFIAPNNYQNSTSKLDMVQVNVSRKLLDLPGGPLQFSVSGALRFESIYNPSANPDTNGTTNRWFTINPFGTIGARRTQAAAFEVDAPIVEQLDLSLSGRYDNYSSGQSAFSPKIGGKYKPIKELTIRSTYSEGFRIPSFAESNSLPTSGYVTATAPASFLAAHGNDGYGQNYNLGLTTVGTPGLKPEHSQNFTLGAVVDPNPHFSFSVDYYHIVKKDVIAPNSANQSAAVAAYYNGTPEPAGYTVIPGIPDPNYPNAQPTLGYLQYGFTNLNRELAEGIDLGATSRFTLPYDIKWTSSLDGTYVLRLDLTTPNGTQHYAGTIGPYYNVSASGTPKFRANWSNTLTYDKVSATLTAYYTDGYQLEAEDFGDTTGVCVSGGASASSINTTYLDGVTPVLCKVKSFTYFDFHGAYKITPKIELYVDVKNILDASAPFDPTTYGGTNYNPAWANEGIYGRYYKVGATAKF